VAQVLGSSPSLQSVPQRPSTMHSIRAAVAAGSAASSGSAGRYKGQSAPLVDERTEKKTVASVVVLGKPLDEEVVHQFMPYSGMLDHHLFHWMLWFVFEYANDPENPESRLAELTTKDVDGKKIIKAQFTKMEIVDALELVKEHGWQVIEDHEHAFPELSPKDVFDAAMSNPMNEQEYRPIVYNCQQWVKETCESLGCTIQATDLAQGGGIAHIGVRVISETPAKIARKIADKKEMQKIEKIGNTSAIFGNLSK